MNTALCERYCFCLHWES